MSLLKTINENHNALGFILSLLIALGSGVGFFIGLKKIDEKKIEIVNNNNITMNNKQEEIGIQVTTPPPLKKELNSGVASFLDWEESTK